MPSGEKSTAEIIHALQQGWAREENFTSLCERYYPRIYDFFLKKGISAESAKDLTQDVFISIYKGVGSLREVDKFEHWLYKIAKHAYWSSREPTRERQPGTWPEPRGEVPSLEKVAEHSSSEGNPEQAILDKERLGWFQEVCQRLPEQRRRCLQLRVEGLSYKQIALVLGVATETVRSHLRLVRATLRERLATDTLAEEDTGS